MSVDLKFFDVDRLKLKPEAGDTIRLGCPHCCWRTDPIDVPDDGPNGAWRAYQSIDHLFRRHLSEAHPPHPPLRLVAVEATS